MTAQIRDEYAVLDDINLPDPGAARSGLANGTAAAPAASGTAAAEDGAVAAPGKVESRSATAKIIDAMPKVSDG